VAGLVSSMSEQQVFPLGNLSNIMHSFKSLRDGHAKLSPVLSSHTTHLSLNVRIIQQVFMFEGHSVPCSALRHRLNRLFFLPDLDAFILKITKTKWLKIERLNKLKQIKEMFDLRKIPLRILFVLPPEKLRHVV
jgi:hypothetical protein